MELIRVSVDETDVHSTAAPCNIGNAAADCKTRACAIGRRIFGRISVRHWQLAVPPPGWKQYASDMNQCRQCSDLPILAPIFMFHERPAAIWAFQTLHSGAIAANAFSESPQLAVAANRSARSLPARNYISCPTLHSFTWNWLRYIPNVNINNQWTDLINSQKHHRLSHTQIYLITAVIFKYFCYCLVNTY